MRSAVVPLVFVLFGAARCMACDCAAPSVQQAFAWADAVFRGTVTNVTRLKPGKRDTRLIVNFAVQRVWKGDVPARFAMYSRRNTNWCEGFVDAWLKPGEELLVYANRQPVEHFYARYLFDRNPQRPPGLPKSFNQEYVYTTGLCSRTQSAVAAEQDLAGLGPGEPPR